MTALRWLTVFIPKLRMAHLKVFISLFSRSFGGSMFHRLAGVRRWVRPDDGRRRRSVVTLCRLPLNSGICLLRVRPSASAVNCSLSHLCAKWRDITLIHPAVWFFSFPLFSYASPAFLQVLPGVIYLYFVISFSELHELIVTYFHFCACHLTTHPAIYQWGVPAETRPPDVSAC